MAPVVLQNQGHPCRGEREGKGGEEEKRERERRKRREGGEGMKEKRGRGGRGEKGTIKGEVVMSLETEQEVLCIIQSFHLRPRGSLPARASLLSLHTRWALQREEERERGGERDATQ